MRPWFCGGLNRRVNRERRQLGWYFMKTDERKARLSDYEKLFKGYLTRIKKERHEIISEKINTESDTCLWRPGRKVLVSEVSNQSLDEVAIDMNNRWSKRERAKGMDPSMEIR